MTIKEKAKVYAYHILNAYRKPEDRIDPGIVLELKIGLDWAEELTAMIMAMISMTNELYPGLEEYYTDLVGFTHLLNRAAIQYSVFPDD